MKFFRTYSNYRNGTIDHKLIMGHSLNMNHLLVTSFLQQQIHLQTANCRRQSCDFLLTLYKTTNQCGSQAQTVVQKHKHKDLIRRMCSFHIAELLFIFWFLKTCCWFICSERCLHCASLPLLPPLLTPTEGRTLSVDPRGTKSLRVSE